MDNGEAGAVGRGMVEELRPALGVRCTLREQRSRFNSGQGSLVFFAIIDVGLGKFGIRGTEMFREFFGKVLLCLGFVE